MHSLCGYPCLCARRVHVHRLTPPPFFPACLIACLPACAHPFAWRAAVSPPNKNFFTAAAAGKATVWDTAVFNGYQARPANVQSVKIPCYQDGSPVDNYFGGDMAYRMVAWSNGDGTTCELRCSCTGWLAGCRTPALCRMSCVAGVSACALGRRLRLPACLLACPLACSLPAAHFLS